MAKFDENYFKTDDTMNCNCIEDILCDDEQILWRGKPKKAAFIIARILSMLPVVLIWLIFDGSFIGIMIGTGAFLEMPPPLIVFIVVFFLFHLCPVWIWLSGVLTANREHKNIEYAFTNTRIIIRSGLVGIDVNSIYYSEITGVNLKVGFIDRLLKVGDIYISGAYKSQVLWDITDPYMITAKLQKIAHDIKTDISYPNALRPEENPGFRTKYKG